MKLTKFCTYPWTFMQVHAGGMMQCCSVGPDVDLGDFILDYCEKEDNGIDPFNSEGLQLVREGLLTGNLRPMCRDCFFVPNELITTEEMQRRLKEILRGRIEGDLDQLDLTKVHAYSWMAISFTNRCNLSCIYCVQSVHKDTNPYFKMDFPYEYAEKTLDLFASQGIKKFSTCVEGEATIYRNWYDTFSAFHKKYPDIELWMTTNLNRKYSDDELELLANYTVLDISIDSIDSQVYSELRVNGRLELLLKNLELIEEKVRMLGIEGPSISLHAVVSDKTWRGMEALADFAFSHGYKMNFGNYEERVNTIAAHERLLKPIRQMPIEEQQEAKEMFDRIRNKADQTGNTCVWQGEIFGDIQKHVKAKYNYFDPYDDNPVFNAFVRKYSDGTEQLHLDIVYDNDNVSHEGIVILRGAVLELDSLKDIKSIIVREVQVFKTGTVSGKYGQTVVVRYRTRIHVGDGKIEYSPHYTDENIEKILLEIVEWS